MKSKESDAPSGEQREGMLELIELEGRCMVLRGELGVEHRLCPARLGESAAHAAHQLIAQHAADFLSVHAADGTYLWASPSVKRLFGWAPEALVGRSAYDFFHPDDLDLIAESHRQHLAQSGATAVEYRLRRADGGHCWVETHSTNCKGDNDLPQIVSITRDISPRRAREQQAQALLARVEAEMARQADSASNDAYLRICAWCKAIADDATDDAKWVPVDQFLTELTSRTLTHGVCETCAGALRDERSRPL
jgi:PAS domain S-box-containing protein